MRQRSGKPLGATRPTASRSTRYWPRTRLSQAQRRSHPCKSAFPPPSATATVSPVPAAEAFRGPAPRSLCTSSSIPSRFFIRLVGVARPPDPTGAAAIAAQQRLARNKSVLDAVLENAQRTRARLGASDQRRMDEFLDSVRAVERRVVGSSTAMGGMACSLTPSFEMPTVEQSAAAPRHTTAGYSKESHADAMNELIALAFECDLTRVISYMLEDERSEFTYDHVQERAFTAGDIEPKGWRLPGVPFRSARGRRRVRHASRGGTSARWQTFAASSTPSRKANDVERPRQHGGLPGLCMHGGDHLGNRATGRAHRRR